MSPKPLTFGMFQLVPARAGASDAQVLRDNLELARLAEDYGFRSVWAAEHHFSPYGIVNDPMLYLAAVAAVTTRIRLGAGVMVVPLHDPVRLAENTSWVDTLSGGRLDVGIGRGYQPHEFVSFGVAPEEAQARTDEAVEFLQAAWTQDCVDFNGRFFEAAGINLRPRPVQQPHPPLFTAAASPATFERTGSRGERILTSPNFTPIDVIRDNFAVYRSALGSAGFDPADYDYPIMQQVYVGADAQRAYDEPHAASMEYYEQLGRLLPTSTGREGGDRSYAFYGKIQRHVETLEYDFLYEHGVCFGDSGRIVERLQRLQEEVGMTYFMGWFNFGSLDHEQAKASLLRFADEVMPHFDVA